MVDYSPVRLLPLAWESPERCNLFGLLGNFQRCLYAASENSLISYGIFLVNIRTAAVSPHIFSPRFSVAASSALRIDLPLLLHRLLPIGTRAYRTGSRSSPYTHYSVWTCRKAFPEPCLQMLTGCPSCRIVVKETADLGIVSQYALRLCEIGNGVQDDIILRGQSGHCGLFLTRMERNER